jgi:hypothetical protein
LLFFFNNIYEEYCVYSKSKWFDKQTNQKIYVATETGNIYKLNYSGQVDNLFFSNVGTSFNNKVNKIYEILAVESKNDRILFEGI